MSIFQINSRKTNASGLVAHYFRMSDFDITIQAYADKMRNNEIVEFEVCV
jgi:hypothetical protein